MTGEPKWGAGLLWSPRRLGRSLPLHPRLWLSRGIVIAAVVGVGGWALWQGFAAFFPAVDAEPDANLVVVRYLHALELPRWDPGPALEAAARPSWEAFSPPPFWRGGSVGEPPLTGRALELAREGGRQLQSGNPEAAAASYLRAATLQPTWEVLYPTGLALLAAGDPERAADQLGEAEARLLRLSTAGASSPVFYAALVATRYAAGLAHLEGDCLDAILELRRSVSALDAYVSVNGALVRDRLHPFQVSEAGIDSHAVWATLASAYYRCEGKFPGEYEKRHGWKEDFAKEYRSPARPEVRDGPFANALAACITTGGRSARCWAYSNLNQPAWASRMYFAGTDEKTVGQALPPSVLSSLTRLVYDVAWLAGQSDKDRMRASTYVAYAARLNRKANVPGLADRIAALGRHLAPATKDYSLLAETWHRRDDLSSLTLDERFKLEDLKGAVWALQDRWLQPLRSGHPDLMIQEVESQVHRAGPYGTSLRDWKEDVQARFRDALIDAMRTTRRNGDLGAALAIRDFRAPWLGPAWRSQALRAWLTLEIWLRWAFLFLLWVLAVAAACLFHRLVVFPYLLYTTDFYRLEHQRRRNQRKRQGKPFTRQEIEDAQTESPP
jgi:hypothetical protein